MNHNVRVMKGIRAVSLLAIAALLACASPTAAVVDTFWAEVDVEMVHVTDFMLAPPGSLFDPVPLEAPLQLGDLFTVLIEVTNHDIETHIVGPQYSYEISPVGSVTLYGEVLPWMFIYWLAPDESCWLTPICPAQWFEATETGLVTVFVPDFGGDTIQFMIHPEPVTGDFDGDNDVDGVDFGLWQSGYPTANGAALGDGDADEDGDVDGVDFGIWQANYPANVGGAATIPEPATLALLLIGGLLLLRPRHRSA